MSATTLDASGNTLTGRTVTWSTSDAAIASVNTSGSVTGESIGEATITATSEGRNGSASITVLTDVASVVVIPDPAVVISTLTVQMTATAQAAGGLALTGKTFTWMTADPSIATVDANGLVTGGTPGSTTLSATAEGVTGQANVDVLIPPPVLVASVNPNPLVEGQTASITGAGFSSIVGENTVVVDGVTAVVTQATTTSLNIVLDRFQFLNWDLRSLEDAFNPPASRLAPRARAFADFQDDFSVRAASSAFFDLSGTGRPATAVRIRDQSGNLLPDFFQVWIVRVE